MSLILDALRKSEAERRRGNLPALALELPPAPTRPAHTSRWWVAVPVALVIAAATVWVMRPADNPSHPPRVAESTPVPAAAAPRPASTPVVEERVPDPPPASAPAREPVPAVEPATTPPPVATPADATPGTMPMDDPPAFALADLTADERRALPPLKLSMHMWSPAPADRFVILDGHRLGEGDRAGNAVVERIDQDGAILATDGRRIRLPLP